MSWKNLRRRLKGIKNIVKARELETLSKQEIETLNDAALNGPLAHVVRTKNGNSAISIFYAPQPRIKDIFPKIMERYEKAVRLRLKAGDIMGARRTCMAAMDYSFQLQDDYVMPQEIINTDHRLRIYANRLDAILKIN